MTTNMALMIHHNTKHTTHKMSTAHTLDFKQKRNKASCIQRRLAAERENV